MGGVDVLVCSAGGAGPNHTMWVPLDAWRQVIDVNTERPLLLQPRGGAGDDEAHYGRIVNIAWIAGKECNPTASDYSASKAAVIGLANARQATYKVGIER